MLLYMYLIFVADDPCHKMFESPWFVLNPGATWIEYKNHKHLLEHDMYVYIVTHRL